MKTFTTTGVCIPSENYMVNLDDRIIQIREMVERGEYFTINRARQYGKTTTLNALYNSLLQKYTVLYLSFEGIGDAGFTSEHSFVRAFSIPESSPLFSTPDSSLEGRKEETVKAAAHKAETPIREPAHIRAVGSMHLWRRQDPVNTCPYLRTNAVLIYSIPRICA